MKQIKSTYIGLIAGLVMIAASLIAYYSLKLPIESNFQFVIYLIFTSSITWALYQHFKSETGNKGFKDYFSIGFKTFVVIALLMAIFTYVFFSFNTGFRDDKIAENAKLLLAEGDHLPNEIEENTKQLKKLFMPIMISSAMFRYLIIGALITAVGGGYLSTRKISN